MFTRRTYLQLVGLAGGLALAGCTTVPVITTPHIEDEPDYGTWFDDVSNYDGTYDHRGETPVEVAVGAKGGLGHYKYAPAAIAISPGTTVTWRWTGNGGGHDVVAGDGSFGSGALQTREDHTFSHTFSEEGVFTYYCTPHKSMGMRGAVFVTAAA